ncbi:MAG: hypothetical protein R3C49_26790 [Planctomycetaceae bacterium]
MAALFREEKSECDLEDLRRPVPQHKRLMAKLRVIEELGDEMISDSISRCHGPRREIRQRRKKKQLLVRLMDGQHSLWSDADACLSDRDLNHVIDIPDIVHVAGYVGKAAKVLVRGKAARRSSCELACCGF